MTISSSTSISLFFLILTSSYSTTAGFDGFPDAYLPTYTSNNITALYKILLSVETNGFQFACGFYCPNRGCSSFLLGIFIYPQTGNFESPMVVWSANPDYLVSENAILNLTAAGELVLRESDGKIVWSAGKSVARVKLTDTGNLVLLHANNSVVWQSFDHPTDCLLPGQKLSEGQKLKSSVSFTSSRSQESMYSLQVTDKGLFAYVESNLPQAYYGLVFHNNKDVFKRIAYMWFLNGNLTFFRDSFTQRSPVDVIGLPRTSSAQYMRLMSDGHLKLFQWQSREWNVVDVLTTSDYAIECGFPLVCGRNSICSNDQQCSCPNIEYFRPVNESQLDMGCSEITPLTCNSTQDQHFITLENVAYFTSTADMNGVNMEACKLACLNNCSCKAAFFKYDTNASSGNCFLASELFTIGIDPLDNSTPTFIKVQNASPHSSHLRVVEFTIGSFVLLLIVAIGIITYIVHKRKKDAEMKEEYLDQVPGTPTRFSYDELKIATENFSKKLGEGGFGMVFEGSLKDGSKIAVKCLEGLSHIKKSFIAEVQSIGSIHHVNLVRLRGLCTWKSQRFLVYDFMSNGSLDRWIYHGNRKHVLEWESRKKIILDIAKGLAYLHEECRQKVVHLDIKPQNILLDNDFNAKVSDFGLSKLIDKNQTQVMTTIKGTPGYMAPEWRSSIITEKMDVYSFGVVLLEILCGRKIFDRSEQEESWYLLFVFQKCWEQGTLLNMVDRDSEDMQAHKAEVVEMMKVASWCLQSNFKRRPPMSSVVKVLEGVMNVESNLDYNFTDQGIQETDVEEEKDLTRLSSSILSGPR